MKKVVIAVLVILAGWLSLGGSPVFAQASEEITSFASDITVNQNTSITIKETIHYQTTLDKHGIYRYFPLVYNRDGLRHELRFTQITVRDERGQTIPYERSYDMPFLTLKIGDPDRTFTGPKTYVITYTVEQALNRFDSHDELYWDITGEGWQVPIMSSQATIHSPFAPVERVECFSGIVGGNDGRCTKSIADTQTASFTYPESIRYGDNFTVVVGFNKSNQLIFPSQWDTFWSWLRYNWVILLIPVPVGVLLVWWWKKGRDFEFYGGNVYDLTANRPTRLRPFQLSAREPYVYAPLDDLSPGEAGALLDEKVDTQDVVAEILELARKKFLKIELIEKKKLFGVDRDYQLTKLKAASSKLPEVQSYLLTELFQTNDVVKVSKLKGTFYTTMQTAANKLEKALVDRQIFVASPTMARVWGMVVFFGLGGVVFWLILVHLTPLHIVWPLLALFVQIPFGLILTYNLPQRTAVGSNLWLQSRGLRKTIKYGKWREEINEKHLFVENVLPFAVALGVVQQLARDMEELNIKPPSYVGTTNLTSWGTAQLVSGFSNEMASSLSYNPSSSSSSGGSGFSGGSSGGGGGGGGGGSW